MSRELATSKDVWTAVGVGLALPGAVAALTALAPALGVRGPAWAYFIALAALVSGAAGVTFIALGLRLAYVRQRALGALPIADLLAVVAGVAGVAAIAVALRAAGLLG